MFPLAVLFLAHRPNVCRSLLPLTVSRVQYMKDFLHLICYLTWLLLIRTTQGRWLLSGSSRISHYIIEPQHLRSVSYLLPNHCSQVLMLIFSTVHHLNMSDHCCSIGLDLLPLLDYFPFHFPVTRYPVFPFIFILYINQQIPHIIICPSIYMYIRIYISPYLAINHHSSIK